MSPKTSSSFDPELFGFLRDLRAHNDRGWFTRERSRYEAAVLEPALRFISEFGPHLRKISTQFEAIPRASGGSLFRIHRDVRFARDKSPYKTHVGIQFRHRQHRDAHAPGFYLHLDPEGCFAGLGIWLPAGPALKSIRDAVATDAAGWRRAVGSKAFRERLELSGEQLSRPPRGFAADHPLVDDLRRKSFIAVAPLTEAEVTGPGMIERYFELCKAGAPLVRFLCRAVDLEV